MKLYHALAIVALAGFAPCVADAHVDVAAIKAHATPASDSVEAARVCAAVTYMYALSHSDDDVDGDYQVLSDAWGHLAADRVGVTYDHYIYDEVIEDGTDMAYVDSDTITFYEGWCGTALGTANPRQP